MSSPFFSDLRLAPACMLPIANLWFSPSMGWIIGIFAMPMRSDYAFPTCGASCAKARWPTVSSVVWPTVTWPSHTTIITGVAPSVHGILGNRRPRAEGGDYYWDASLLKVQTLLDVARASGLKSAAITWPVTVNAPVDYNLPEFFAKRNGGAMDLHSIEAKYTPGLVKEIAAMYPSFAQEWMDDRTRAQAVMFLLRAKRPDLILVHLVDHDAEAHETGPFTREANAKIEHTDELIGDILKVLPGEYVVALVSDHGFERTDSVVNIQKLAPAENANVTVTPFLLLARKAPETSSERWLKKLKTGLGAKYLWISLTLCSGSYQCGGCMGAHRALHVRDQCARRSDHRCLVQQTAGKRQSRILTLRQDYRSVFLLWGPGIKSRRIPQMDMTDIVRQLASVLDLHPPQ